MKSIAKVVILLCTITIILNASTLKQADSYEHAIEQGIKTDKNILMFMHNPHCPWCTKMEHETLSNLDVIKYINKNYIFVSIDVDMDDFPSKFRPIGTPTTYVVNPKTEEKVFTMKGYKSAKSLLYRLKR